MGVIRVYIDENVTTDISEGVKQSRNSLSNLIAKAQNSIIEVNTEAMTTGLENIYSNLVDSICKLQKINENVEIDNIQFSIGIDSTGQFSLLSAVSASSQYKTGITFTVRFKKE